MNETFRVERWFPSALIWISEVSDIDNVSIAEYIRELKIKNSGRVYSNIGGWQSDAIHPQLDCSDWGLPDCLIPLHDKLTNCIEQIATKYSFKQNLMITDYWFNVNTKGDRNIPHIHPSCVLSGVYYVKTDGTGELKFQRDQHQAWMWNTFTDSKHMDTSNHVAYKPVESRAIMFPAWVSHSVESHDSDEERISIAFNAE
jgi:uncharacterized protein (TIGR02466 family)